MKIDNLVFPVHALGPGNRIALWMLGCSRCCPGCISPEFWDSSAVPDTPLDKIKGVVAAIFKDKPVDGVTISGGEPFEQAAELMELVSFIRPYCEDILIYTGYTLDELQKLNEVHIDKILEQVAVIIDGPYVADLNDNDSALRGSTNQQVHYLNADVKAKYAEYIAGGRRIQNLYTDKGLIMIGIHNTGPAR